jgi:hypothetical protein
MRVRRFQNHQAAYRVHTVVRYQVSNNCDCHCKIIGLLEVGDVLAIYGFAFVCGVRTVEGEYRKQHAFLPNRAP